MIDTRLFAFAALALSLAACTNDNEVMDNGPVAARINAEISNAVATRASGTQWATYDQIGVSTIAGTGTYYNNVCYEWNGSSFTTPSENAIYFQTPESVLPRLLSVHGHTRRICGRTDRSQHGKGEPDG